MGPIWTILCSQVTPKGPYAIIWISAPVRWNPGKLDSLVMHAAKGVTQHKKIEDFFPWLQWVDLSEDA
jgi:hypothetical protein